MKPYNHKEIEPKWSQVWKENKTYRTPDTSDKPKDYTIVMFPYPSGDLHIGHWYNFAPTDVYARFKRMSGKNVMTTIGFDAFGLPAEGAAIKRGIHPSDWTHSNIQSMLKQLEKMGPSYDWERTVVTCDPDYYKWTQWCFLKLYEKGLAYKTKAAVNWCPVDKSVLANEQAEGGVCWRCGSQVEQKMIEQWFFKITEYAERLLEGLETLDWPERIKLMQYNWIGKSEGAEITFKIVTEGQDTPKPLTVFTTRPDTLFGATFLVVAPEHPQLDDLTTEEHKREVHSYREQTVHKSELERIADNKKKTGTFTGSYAIHPFTNRKLPVWTADFILANYGTGAIMAVPGHDQRDYDFAKQYDLPIKFILQPAEVSAVIVEKSVDKQLFDDLTQLGGFTVSDFSLWGKMVNFGRDKIETFRKLVQTHLQEGPHVVHTDGVIRMAIFKDKVVAYNTESRSWEEAIAYGKEKKIIPENLDFTFPEEGFTKPFTDTENAYLIDSENFSGLSSADAKKLIVKVLEKENQGTRTIKYKLRDWLVSRQRYWGAPIPIIYCEHCGTVPVPEKDLPVVLPYEVDYTPQEVSPLGSAPDFVNVKCPKCGADAKRDTDTMDTFVDSSWYFLRYPTPHDDTRPFGSAKLGGSDTVNQWAPVDKYVGGAEHAVLHLLYSRFFTKVFADEGYLNFQEPFQSLFNQGIILGPDHQKMSKSKGNVINPDELVEHYGCDAVRMYLCFLGPYDQGGPWNPAGIEGVSRFMRKFYGVLTGDHATTADNNLDVAINKLIKKVTNDLPQMKFNTSVAAFMEFINTVGEQKLTIEQKKSVIKLIAPFAPFLSEELWNEYAPGQGSVHHQSWPTFDPAMLIESDVEIVIQVNGKVRDRFVVPLNTDKDTVVSQALSREIVVKFTEGKQPDSLIFVPNKLLNIVIK